MQANMDRDLGHLRSQINHGEQMGRDWRAAHLRNMRRAQRNGAAGGPWAYLFCYWWLVFPLVFGVLPALERINWDLWAQGAERFATFWIDSSPVAWAIDAVARLMRVSPGDAAAILLLGALVNGAVLILALRLPVREPARTDWPPL
jgi:hypothetical protein